MFILIGNLFILFDCFRLMIEGYKVVFYDLFGVGWVELKWEWFWEVVGG